MTCAHCNMPVALAANEAGLVVRRWPLVTSGRDYPDVPEGIAAVANEAHRCLEALAPRAAATMARAAIEAIAKDKGANGNSLMAKIDSLAASGHISEAMKEAAHEIRFSGNSAAHSDIVQSSGNQDEAEEIVALMSTILDRVYSEPARIARVRARREAREQGKEMPRIQAASPKQQPIVLWDAINEAPF